MSVVVTILRHPLSRLLASISLVALASGLPVRAEPSGPPPASPPPQAGSPHVAPPPVRVADAVAPAGMIPAAALTPSTSVPVPQPSDPETDPYDPAFEQPASAPFVPPPMPPAAVNPPPATFQRASAPTAPDAAAPPPAATVTQTVMGTIITPAPLRPEEITRRQAEYLQQRYDLAGRTHPTIKMSGGRKAIPVGPTARLPAGMTWDRLGKMSPDEIKKRAAFPYVPLWHPLQEAGGMVFPPVQTGVMAGLDRKDMLFDLPDAYLPEFPAPLYLTSRPDLGDVSQGQLITSHNADALFQEILTPMQLEGLKLMLRKTATPQHNASPERATVQPVAGVACMDCHVNGHTTGQFTLTPDVRPQSERLRVDTSSLRGEFVQSWFGTKRALRNLEQFVASEQAAYFDGDRNALEMHGGSALTSHEVEAIAQFIRIIDFPPAPKRSAGGGLDKKLATEAELRGEQVFAGHCQSCHSGPTMTDNLAHDLRVERFYDHMGSTRVGAPGRAEGPMKTPTLRGIKDSPPYLHDGRLLTLEDAVEFFNIVLQARLDKRQRTDLVAYLRTL